MATRVPGIDQDEFKAREAALVEAVVRGLERVAGKMAAQIGATPITAAVTAPMTAAAGDPPGQPYISVDDLGQIPSDWNAYTDSTLLPLMEQTYLGSSVAWTLAVAQSVPGWDADMIPAVSNVMAEDYLAGASNRLRGIGDELWQTSRSQLLQGFKAGESIPELAARVRAAAGVAEPRSLVIARTEVIGASNRGSWDTAKLLGADAPDKSWTATFDERTRQTHRDADNAYREGGDPGPIPIDEAFLVGGYPLMFPAAPEGPISEVASCRCTLVYVFAGARRPRRTAFRQPAQFQGEAILNAPEARIVVTEKSTLTPEALARVPESQRTLYVQESTTMQWRGGLPAGWTATKARGYARTLNGYMTEEGAASPWALRAGSAASRRAATRISELMATSRTSGSMLAWRGLDRPRLLFGDAFDSSLVGAWFRDPSFMSVSGSRDVATRYAQHTSATGGLLMRMHIPAGTRALNVANTDDVEVLLDRGYTLNITSDTGPGSVPRIIDVDLT